MGPSFGGTQLASPGYSQPREKEAGPESETDRVKRAKVVEASGGARPPGGGGLQQHSFTLWQESVRMGQGRDAVKGQGCHASYRESEG